MIFEIENALEELEMTGVDVCDYVEMAEKTQDAVMFNAAILEYHFRRDEVADARLTWTFASRVFNA